MAQINKPTDYFNTVTFTGNNTDGNSITGVGFQPDWCWFKIRSSAGSHALVDSVRGTSKTLRTDGTDSEFTSSAGTDFSSFDSDGFTVDNVELFGSYNNSGASIVTWNWKAGGTASSNTDGSITSSVSANTTSGFSIVSYTGTGSNATVGHGLGAVPKMVICKNRSSGSVGWSSWHTGIGDGNNYILLNTTQSTLTASNIWNSTIPTSSVISVGSHPSTNESGSNMIAYCFAEKKGFNKFGSYTGNNNSDGTFVYLGFKPAWVMIKMSDAAKGWQIYDNKRFTSNPINAYQTLNANSSQAESYSTVYPIDFLSNGFKFNTDASEVNAPNTYIYMAFAENPLVGTNNIPATAR